MSDDPNAWMISGRWKTAAKGVVQERQRVADEGVPVEILRLAYAEYARQYGTSQSFEEIQRRAGFSVGEVIMLLADALGRGEQAGFERGVQAERARVRAWVDEAFRLWAGGGHAIATLHDFRNWLEATDG